MGDSDEIISYFSSLAQRMIQVIQNEQESGYQIVQLQPHMQFSVASDQRYVHPTMNIVNNVQLPTIDTRTQYKLTNACEQYVEFKELEKRIQTLHGEDAGRYPLHSFLVEIINAFVLSGDYPSQSKEIIERYCRDLIQDNTWQNWIVYLSGVHFSGDSPIEILPNITVRNPKNEDFEEKIPYLSLVFNLIDPFRLYTSTTAILEIREDRARRGERPDRIQFVLAGLRLYTNKPISTIFIKQIPASAYRTGSQSIPGDNPPVNNPLLIESGEVSSLNKFFLDFESGIDRIISDKSNHISIAYDKYIESLQYNGFAEKGIANAIMGLEACTLEKRVTGANSTTNYERELQNLCLSFPVNRFA